MKDINTNLALDKLFPREKNLVRNSLNVNNIEDMSAIGEFRHCSYKRSKISNSNFIINDLGFSAWTDSIFDNVKFIKCKMNSSNMQICNFIKSEFIRDVISNVSFCYSDFKNCVFQNITFKNCIFTDTIFTNSKFINCKFSACSFDGAKFIECYFEKLIARNLNLDYSQYRDCRFENSQISLFQCAYTVGLIQTLSKVNSNVMAFQGTEISCEQFYNEYIYYLIYYFQKLDDSLFPLANLLFYLEEYESAKCYILEGIKASMVNHKFRLAYHFCELINFYNCLNSMEKRGIIDFMNKTLTSLDDEINVSEMINYSIKIEKTLLTEYDNRPTYFINLETSYNEKNNTNVLNFINEIDMLLIESQGTRGEHNLTITHNSPLWLDIVVAFGVGIASAYAKDMIDFLIKKIKEKIKHHHAEVKSITIKTANSEDEKVKEVKIKDEKN